MFRYKIDCRDFTDLPRQHASTLGAQQQHRLLRRECDAVDALWEGHHGLLVALFPAVDVDDGLVCLRGEYVRAAHCNAVGRSRAPLEDMSLSGEWLELVHKDARVFGDASVRLRRRRYGGHELFRQHGGFLWLRRGELELAWPELFSIFLVERVCAQCLGMPSFRTTLLDYNVHHCKQHPCALTLHKT
jgi:hypothetical protein